MKVAKWIGRLLAVEALVVVVSIIIVLVAQLLGWNGITAINKALKGEEYTWEAYIKFGSVFGVGLGFCCIVFNYVIFKTKFKSKKRSKESSKTEKQIKYEKQGKAELKKITKDKMVMLTEDFGIPIVGLGQHTMVVGTTGTGKTTTLKKMISEIRTKDKESLTIIIDGKGDEGLIEALKNEKTWVWSIQGDNAWNPIDTEDASVITDMLSTFIPSHEFFEERGVRFLESVINVLKLCDERITVEKIFGLLALENIQTVKGDNGKRTTVGGKNLKIIKYIDDKISSEAGKRDQNWIDGIREYKTYLASVDREHLTGLTDALMNIYNPVKKALQGGKTISQLASRYNTLIFSLNSLKNSKRAEAYGKLLVQVMKEYAGKNEVNVNLIFDELGVFISEDLINLINKSRSFNFRCFLSFQTTDDLKTKKGKDLTDILFGNTNNIVVHKINDNKSKEYIASYFGTEKWNEKTNQIDYGTGESSKGSIREVDKFKAHPNKLTSLRKGECFVQFQLASGNIIFNQIKVVRTEDVNKNKNSNGKAKFTFIKAKPVAEELETIWDENMKE